jgi:aconitate hydratase
VVELNLATVEPSLAGPARPQDRVRLGDVKRSFEDALPGLLVRGGRPKAVALPGVVHAGATGPAGQVSPDEAVPAVAVAKAVAEGGPDVKPLEPGPAHHGGIDAAQYSAGDVKHGSVVIAAITSCTNTSNPSVLMAAGLLAKNAIARGLSTQPYVKTSIAPGSKVVTEYLKAAGLLADLEKLGFHVVGYGCTTCIGNSGPLPEPVSRRIADDQLVVAAVLSGNRNFEGRVHAEVRANYLASPPLVVAYALAGRVDLDLTKEPLGNGRDGKPVFLRDIWPSPKDVQAAIDANLKPEMYRQVYSEIYNGDEQWRELKVPSGGRYSWDEKSTYIKNPPYFDGMQLIPPAVEDIVGARVLAVLGDSITTDHISPAGSIKKDSPAGQYLIAHGVKPADFNSYGSRRGNHEVMMRGTFANIRLKNRLAPGTEGGFTRYLPEGAVTTIFEASERYRKVGVPLIVLAGKEYGSGSSRDWAAKGPRLLDVRAVIAESYERIHRSNLVGMGVLPLQFKDGENVDSLKLSGEETYAVEGLAAAIASGFASGRELTIRVTDAGGERKFKAVARVDTPQEVLYFQHGGILQYVLRQLVK